MDQLAKIKEAVLPLLNAHDIQLYDVCWTNEGRNKILQIAIMHADGSMNTVRNGIAHSRLDLNLEAVHLSDLKIIEELLYAMRLQHLRVDTKSIQIGIKRLFGERISIE